MEKQFPFDESIYVNIDGLMSDLSFFRDNLDDFKKPLELNSLP